MSRRMGWLALSLLALVCGAGVLSAQDPDIIYYKFNQSSGTQITNDANPGAGSATPSFALAPTWVSPGKLGSNAVNPGANNSLDTGYDPTNLNGTSFTIEFWIQASTAVGTSANPEYVLCSGVTTPTPAVDFRIFVGGIAGTAIGFRGGGLTGTDITTATVADGTWHHVAFVYDNGAGTTTAYIDGTQDFQNTSQTFNATLNSLIFGAQLSSGALALTQPVDEFRIWNSARTQTEIQNNMNIEIGQTGPEIDVTDPNGENVADGGTHFIDPISPSASVNFDWDIANVSPNGTLNLGTISVAAVSGCSVSIAGTDPSNSAVATSSSTTLTVQVTGNANPGTLQFTITIPSDDSDENPYNITVNGSRGLSGNFTIDNGGAGDYTDIGTAFDELEDYGVVGAVTFTVSDNGSGYTANGSYELGSDNGIVDDAEVRGTSATNTITFEAASGTIPSISGNFPINLFGVSNFGIVTLAFTNVSNLTFRGFEVSGTTDTNILVYQTASFPGGAVTIERCRIHGNISGAGAMAFGNGQALSGFTFQNNIMWDCGPTGGVFTTSLTVPQNGMLALFNADATCSIEHNTILLTSFGFPTADGCCMSITGGLSDLGGFNYNILQTVAANTKLVDIPAGLEPAAADYNYYYFPAGQATFSPTQVSLALWQSANPTLDQNSSDQDPLLASTTAGSEDLHISGTSPCVDAATGSTAAFDFEGDSRPSGSANDIGADEETGGGGPSTPSVSISATDSSAAENATNSETGEFTITLSPAPASSLTINFTMTGTASTTPGTDYDLSTPTAGVTLSFTGPGGTITVPAGTATVVVTLTPVDDGGTESAETAIMNINSGTGYTVGTTGNSATVTILDNDGTGTPTVTVSASGTPGESGPTPGTFTLNANPVPTGTITVNFTMSGTAVDGTDYNLSVTGSVSIGGSGSATVTLTPIDDSTQEGVETATLTVTAGTGYTVGTPSAATLNIGDNDAAGGTGSVGGGGGGGGGGGCVAVTETTPWLFVLGLLSLLALGMRLRTREE